MSHYIKKFTGLLIVFTGLLGCSMTGIRQSMDRNNHERKIDVLTEFTIAINNRDYHRAVSMLVEGEKEFMTSAGEVVPENIKRKLDRLRLSTLANDAGVRLVNGKLSGIYERLEVLELGPPVYHTLRLVQSEKEPEFIPPPAPLSSNQFNVKRALEKLMNAIQTRNWTKVRKMIDKSDWDLFFSYRGKMLEDMPRRFARIDLTDWQVLQLENGKLQGLYHLIPHGKTQEEIIVNEFIRLVKKEQWNRALEMLSRYERNYLCDKNGNIKKHYRLLLKTMAPEEWDKLVIHDGKLSGVLDWMGLGPYGRHEQYGSYRK